MLKDMAFSKQSPPNEQFTCLLLSHQKRIYNFILTLVPNASDADDIMQETVLVMCRKFDEFSIDTNFTAWAFQIARFNIIKFRRNKHQHFSLLSDEAFEKVSNEIERNHNNIDEHLAALQHCLEKLNKNDRELVSLHYEKGLKINSIAEKYDRSTQGLYKVFSRINNLLRLCIKQAIVR